ncbi:MAG TPA: phasin family protein [Burkholderiales bacterium]|nr:phasin family protein [Burkholderiales bacterium]
MTAKPDNLALTEWKRQLDAALRVVEAIVEGSRKMCETQLEAAIEAHARAEATRKLLAKTGDAQELWRIQSEWMSANLERSLSYWQGHCKTAVDTGTCVADCLSQQAGVFAPQAAAASDASQGTLLDMMNTAYKRWQETTRQFYAAPTVSQPPAREAA